MGEGDTTAKEFLGIDENFADCINYAVFGGQRVVQSTDLRDLDKEEIMRKAKRKGKARSGGSRSRNRDLLRHVYLKEHKGVTYMVVGIENQSTVDCGMAVRCMQYDALRYDRQMRAAIRDSRRRMAADGQTSGRSDDRWQLPTLPPGQRLVPVVTIVVYWGKGRWDGPRSLHELLACEDPRVLGMAADYRLNLIEPYAMKPEDFARFSTELGAVLNYVSVQEDPDALARLLQEDERFRNLSLEALQLLQTVTGTTIEAPEKNQDGRIDMCRAEQILMKRAEEKGMEKGMQEGMEKGMQEGMEKGMQEGMEKGMQEGMEKGMQEGVLGAIELLLEFGKSVADIHAALMRKYSMDAAEASRYLSLKGLSL